MVHCQQFKRQMHEQIKQYETKGKKIREKLELGTTIITIQLKNDAPDEIR